jgi:hypothetical protein
MDNKRKYLDSQYDLFLHEYERGHPRPETDVSGQRRALLLMLGAAVVMSARHNIPFFIGGDTPADFMGQAITIIFAVSVVLMVEIGLVKIGEFLIAYMDRDLVQQLRPILLFIALVLLLVVAMAANVIDQLEVKDIYVNESFKTAITIIAGLTAPIMALITGIIFASLELKVAEDAQKWQTDFNRAWSTFKKKNEVDILVSVPSIPQTDNPPRLSVSASNQTDNRQTGAGYRRSSTAVDNAKDWLLANPEQSKLSVRALAELIPDAGKDSIAKAKRELQAEGKL